ncbi:uncharacterized protein LOC141610465 [Silene latifolia]|uniref:uncharacterized protein LOC141610465 n=1 Tax=Silene latifolia TaxID=37657 RepID=UPI003D78753B
MNTSLTLRRCFCCLTTPSSLKKKKPLVFLGTPQVCVQVLDTLFNASQSSDSFFQVAAIVTQPPQRGRMAPPSPVAQYAMDRGFSPDLILTPYRASEESFLASLQALEPELCITAAYGNILPTKFLKIPTHGTVNIHPSLLPLYRGAAPVQRALQDGVNETGVSLAFTVRALDSGPVIASERITVDENIKAPELLDLLFGLGSGLLVRELPSILDGTASNKARPQDDSNATLAPKIAQEESWLSFDQDAFVVHNKVRAFAGWPGTRVRVQAMDTANVVKKILDLKIITTRVSNAASIRTAEDDVVTFRNGALIFPCGKETALEVLEVQVSGKKVMDATSFWNGLKGLKLQKLIILQRDR